MPHDDRCPIFVGGTGRSGTTIAGELIGAHRDYAMVPIELRFHVDERGLTDLAQGRIDVTSFLTRFYDTWYFRPPRNNRARGVHVVAARDVVDAAAERLAESVDDDPWRACGQFLRDVVDPFRQRLDAQSWVEMTPPNAEVFDLLARMVPEAKFVHMTRDGRDVAASVARRSWGPNDLPSALRWWGEQMVAIGASIRACRPEQVLVVRLERLVTSHREEEYARILAFLGLPDDESMRAFFWTGMTPGASHPGSWRNDRTPQEQADVDRMYEEQLELVSRAGVEFPAADEGGEGRVP